MNTSQESLVNSRSGDFNVRLFDPQFYGFVEGRGMKMRVTEFSVKANSVHKRKYYLLWILRLRMCH